MDVVMPQLGETVTEGTVTAWHKAAGDSVKADETLFEVSTDKVDTEVPAPAGGVLVAEVDWDDGQADEGTSYARVPDVTGDFQTVGNPTPRAANQPGN